MVVNIKRILFLPFALIMFTCTSSEIETESLYNQLELNEKRNAEVIEKLTTTIEIRGNKYEELVFLKKVTNLMRLKKQLGLNSNQVNNSSSYNLAVTITYIDTLTARFESVYENEEFLQLLSQTRNKIENSDGEVEDEYLHTLLQMSYCETNLFAYYGKEVGVQELFWEDDSSIYKEETYELDSLATGLKFKTQSNYTSTKQEANKLRESLTKKYQAATDPEQKEVILDSAGIVFSNYLLNKIIPHWYNTEWDFDGYTAIPNQGTIACGYFVSTTLQDMGVKVNRYKLAQQNPENEAKTVAIKESLVKSYNYLELEPAIDKELKNYEEGLYFVGLDNHVGYLYIKNGQAYFIHSDYVDGFVRIEHIETSEAFESETYFISNISSNRGLVLKWIMEEEVVVIREELI